MTYDDDEAVKRMIQLHRQCADLSFELARPGYDTNKNSELSQLEAIIGRLDQARSHYRMARNLEKGGETWDTSE